MKKIEEEEKKNVGESVWIPRKLKGFWKAGQELEQFSLVESRKSLNLASNPKKKKPGRTL